MQYELDSTYNLINKFGLSYNNLTGLGLDNTNSNKSSRNSIKQQTIRKEWINFCQRVSML